MTSREITIAGFVVLFVLAGVLVIAARWRPDWLGKFGEALEAASGRHIVLRILVAVCWAWLGWHFLARTG